MFSVSLKVKSNIHSLCMYTHFDVQLMKTHDLSFGQKAFPIGNSLADDKLNKIVGNLEHSE